VSGAEEEDWESSGPDPEDYDYFIKELQRMCEDATGGMQPRFARLITELREKKTELKGKLQDIINKKFKSMKEADFNEYMGEIEDVVYTGASVNFDTSLKVAQLRESISEGAQSEQVPIRKKSKPKPESTVAATERPSTSATEQSTPPATAAPSTVEEPVPVPIEAPLDSPQGTRGEESLKLGEPAPPKAAPVAPATVSPAISAPMTSPPAKAAPMTTAKTVASKVEATGSEEGEEPLLARPYVVTFGLNQPDLPPDAPKYIVATRCSQVRMTTWIQGRNRRAGRSAGTRRIGSTRRAP
jgi:hypothetical protein